MLLKKISYAISTFSFLSCISNANASPNTSLPTYIAQSISNHCTLNKKQEFYDVVNEQGFEVFPLGNGRKLWLVTCFVGESNSDYAVILSNGTNTNRVLFTNTLDKSAPSDLVVNASFNRNSFILTEEDRMGANYVTGAHWKLSGDKFVLKDIYETEDGHTNTTKAP